MYNTILFDLDGVILDTEPTYTKFWNEMGKVIHPELPNFACRIKGQTLVQIFESYVPDTDMQQFLKHQVDELEQKMSYHYIHGFVDFINHLRNELHLKTAIVTSSNLDKMSNVYRQLPELAHYFDIILTSEDFKRSKPFPDCYLTAAQHLGVNTDECIVFEDSINGLKAGRSANMKTCGMTTTLPADIIAPYSDVIFPDFIALTFEKVCFLLDKNASLER